jgi:hypothetical protein
MERSMLKTLEYGDVIRGLKENILRYLSMILEDESIYVEVYLFDNLDNMIIFLNSEYREFNISFSDIYFAMHDAYRGWPRIYVCIELLEKMPRDVWIGGVMHEAGHAILHGSPIYFYISLPDNLLILLNEKGVNDDTALKLLHYASVSVKDYEVSRYMVEKGYTSYQYPFIRYNLELNDDEIEIWRSLRNPMARVEYILKILKVLASALPLLEDYKYRESIREAIKRLVERLDMGYEKRIYKIINVFKELKGDTRDNIYFLSKHLAEILFE